MNLRRMGLVGLLVTLAFNANTLAAERPNIIVVLADDLGYGDLGCYGSEEVKTPNLDKFAAQGIRFTDCYAASANCSPARTGLMTGRTPFRVGVHNWIPMFSPMHVQAKEITIATLLQKNGYRTCHVGKWHLNGMFNSPEQPQPNDHGFDHWFSTQNNALPNHQDPDNFVRNGKPVGKLKGYAAEVVVTEAIDWLSSLPDDNAPFFLFVCFHEPHEPIATHPKYREMYPSNDPSYGAHHGNITQMDAEFGRLMGFLKQQQKTDDTLVLFTSDNGPAITGMHPHGSSGGLRDKKGYMYEGGIRVPGILSWPGHTKPGTVCNEPICGVDVLPTLCEITGIDVPTDRALDGASIVPVLSEQSIQRDRPLYWQFNRARGAAKVAIRKGDWKLLASLDVPDPKPSGDLLKQDMIALKSANLTNFQLFNLRKDPTEAKDMAKAEPELYNDLIKEMKSTYVQVREESPVWPEWEWPRYESSRIEWTEQSRRGQRAKAKPKQ